MLMKNIFEITFIQKWIVNFTNYYQKQTNPNQTKEKLQCPKKDAKTTMWKKRKNSVYQPKGKKLDSNVYLYSY